MLNFKDFQIKLEHNVGITAKQQQGFKKVKVQQP